MQYHSPATFEEASGIAVAAEGATRFLAGGTDVLVQLRSDMVAPETLVDIKTISGSRILARGADGGWDIGAAVSGAEMSENTELSREWPGLVEAMALIGSIQIQGRATLAGNLCNASPAADSVPAMVAAGAVATVAGPDGLREIAVESIPAGPGRTTLGKGELVSKIHIPARGAGGGDAYLRFIPRTEMDIAVVGCAVNLRRDGDIVTEARVSLGAVAPTVLLVDDAGEALVGSKLDEAALVKVAEAASAACRPIDDRRGTIAFRTQVAGVLAKRAARIAYDRAGEMQ